MILPADMPGFSSAALADLISRFRAEPELIWRGSTLDGTPGHPAIIPRDLWPEVLALFPELGVDATSFPAARLSLKAHEARVLILG